MDIVITEFKNRKNPIGKVRKISWDDFVEKLKKPVITDESLDEYRKMSNEDRTEAKDCGGYVAGEFEYGKRAKILLKNRYVLTIDADDATPHDVDDFDCYGEPWIYFCHTTHTSTVDAPRLRWLFLLSRPVTPEEYPYLVKYVSGYVGAETLDETTDQPERLMFWPSVSLDADYQYWQGGSSPLDVDSILEEVEPDDDYEVPVVHEKPKTEVSPSGDLIPVGGRNRAVYSFACSLRAQGMEEDTILQMVKVFNADRLEEPLPDDEIKTIVRSACTHQKGDPIPFEARTEDTDFSDLGEIGQSKVKIGRVLENGTQLRKRYIKPAVYLVEDMVSPGMGFVVAPPKFGKSWFALDLALSVATGTEFFGKKTQKAGVLYYALEDNDRRLQERMDQVAAERDDLDLFFHTEEAPGLDNGLFDDIDDQIKQHPEIKLVVIDTFQKIRGQAKRNEGAYQHDYSETGRIQKFALKRDISILLVHHTRKIIDPNDLIGNVSGTNGTAGAADYVFGMTKKKWDDQEAKLEITGRDVKTQTYVMTFNEMSHRWEKLGREQEVREGKEEEAYRTSPLTKTIKYYLDEIESETTDNPVVWKVTVSDLISCVKSFSTEFHLDYEEDTSIRMGMKISSIEPLLEKIDGIKHSGSRSSKGHLHVFSRPRKEQK